MSTKYDAKPNQSAQASDVKIIAHMARLFANGMAAHQLERQKAVKML
jgi:hypothetical protein